ncbi:RNA polymerase II C-terminal domain phosphatase-like 4 [Chenopodium quinoa]|uniref:protein-serine/threonine phosphatase n=1 Tax=Chenopodium quinoa TaxID=63459 RepID=A0A803LEI2_CHEQI|nr:RNA polymerase II C-terminal domain phosphatase-like 4 [Chenopodium quinoa]
MNSSITKSEINRIPDNNLQCLLNSKKLHLILDLDHTLVHSRMLHKLTSTEKETIDSNTNSNSIEDNVYKICGGNCVVKLRPGVREFITLVSSMFELSIYTMGSRYYAQQVHELLVSKAGFPSNCSIVVREDCVKERRKGFDNVVLSHEQVVVIVDDTEKIWEESCKRNLLKIGGYNYFPIKEGFDDQEVVDTELARVFRVLMLVHTLFYDDSFVINNGWSRDYGSRDVRDVLEAVLISSVSGCGDKRGDAVCSKKRSRDSTIACVQTEVKRSRTSVDYVVDSVQLASVVH